MSDWMDPDPRQVPVEATSRDGVWDAVVAEQRLFVFDTKTHTRRWSTSLGDLPCTDLVFSRHRHVVACVGPTGFDVFDHDGRHLRRHRRTSSAERAAGSAVSADGKRLAACFGDRGALFDLEADPPAELRPLPTCHQAAFSPGDDLLAVALPSRDLEVLDLTTQKTYRLALPGDLPAPRERPSRDLLDVGGPGPPSGVRAIDFTADGAQLAMSVDRSLLVFDLVRRSVSQRLLSDAGPHARVALAFAGDQTLRERREGWVSVWDLERGTAKRTDTPRPPRQPTVEVWRAKLTNEELVAERLGAGLDVEAWNLDTGKRSSRPAVDEPPISRDETPDGHDIMATDPSTRRHLVRLARRLVWRDPAGVETLTESADLGAEIFNASISENGKHVVATTRSRVVRILSASKLELEASFVVGEKGAALILPDGTYQQWGEAPAAALCDHGPVTRPLATCEGKARPNLLRRLR